MITCIVKHLRNRHTRCKLSVLFKEVDLASKIMYLATTIKLTTITFMQHYGAFIMETESAINLQAVTYDEWEMSKLGSQ